MMPNSVPPVGRIAGGCSSRAGYSRAEHAEHQTANTATTAVRGQPPLLHRVRIVETGIRRSPHEIFEDQQIAPVWPGADRDQWTARRRLAGSMPTGAYGEAALRVATETRQPLSLLKT
ncbi:MAG: hypothetical protein H7A16_01755 [Sinobacteraceae bacterium]|nr:hypothetical protein [Nevskiaceae bacterium]